eukprot:scaffold4029_cov117-Isochrysis_galbana.AAC.4
MSISSYASDSSAASIPHSCEFSLADPSSQSGMVQPVVNEMFATVHAAGSSLLGLYSRHVQPSIRQGHLSEAAGVPRPASCCDGGDGCRECNTRGRARLIKAPLLAFFLPPSGLLLGCPLPCQGWRSRGRKSSARPSASLAPGRTGAHKTPTSLLSILRAPVVPYGQSPQLRFRVPGLRSPSDTVIDEGFSSSQSKVIKSNESAELPPRDNLLFTAASQVLGHGTGVGQFSVRDNYDMFVISPPPSPPSVQEYEGGGR